MLIELWYDQFHSNKDNIYKVTAVNTDRSIMETNPRPVVRKLEDEYPDRIPRKIYFKNSLRMYLLVY